MGRHHSLLGGTAWMGMGALAGMPAVPLAASAAACAAGAMLPDIDEPESTVAHLCGPVTLATAWLTKRISGGHRHATHSLAAVAVAGIVGLSVTPFPLARAVILALLFALFLRVLSPPPFRYRICCFTVAGLAARAVVVHTETGWLPIALAAGVTLHLVGDLLTSGGVPLLWPNPTHLSWPVLGHTRSHRETAFAAGLWVALLAVSLVTFGAVAHPVARHVEPSIQWVAHHQ
jgi:membrane-bound metal-dependent hydrolase YbcI (DUF457 family)